MAVTRKDHASEGTRQAAPALESWTPHEDVSWRLELLDFGAICYTAADNRETPCLTDAGCLSRLPTFLSPPVGHLGF